MSRCALRFDSLLLVPALIGLLLAASSASSFSTGSPVCVADAAQMISGHGPTQGVTGSYSLEVRRAGIPVSSVIPGETVQVRITNPQGVQSRGFTLRAQLGSTAGAGVGGFVLSSGQQFMPGCSPSSSGLTQTSPVSVSPPRIANWTVPATLVPGQQVVFSSLVTESAVSRWVVVSPVTVSIAAPPPVPGLGLISLVATGAGLVGLAAWQLRRA